MLLSEVRVLLGNAKYQISGAAAKESINTMIEQIEESVLNGEEVQLTYVTHKNTGIVYLLCNAAAVDEKKFVCVPLYGGNPKLYSASTIKRMFRKTVETLEVEDTDAEADTASEDTVPAAVDTNDKDAAADQADTESDDPEVPNTEAADKTEQDDTAANQNDKAAGNKFSREDYKFFKSKTNALAAEIIKYFCSRGYEAKFVSNYVKIFSGKRTLTKLYYSRKNGTVRMAVSPDAQKMFESCFPSNSYTTVKGWTLSLKVFISKDENLKDLHKFLDMLDGLYVLKFNKGVSK